MAQRLRARECRVSRRALEDIRRQQSRRYRLHRPVADQQGSCSGVEERASQPGDGFAACAFARPRVARREYHPVRIEFQREYLFHCQQPVAVDPGNIGRGKCQGGLFESIQIAGHQAVCRKRDHLAVGEVWGIGRRISERLIKMKIKSVHDLITADIKRLRAQFGVVMERTVSELRGISCLALEDIAPSKQQIMSSRSFGSMMHTIELISEAVAWHVHTAAEKLRAQRSVAGAIYVFIQTNRFRDSDPQYNGGMVVPLADVSDDTRVLTTAALHGLRRIFRDGYAYKKCGVMLMELQDKHIRQETLFDDPQARVRSARVMVALDAVNRVWGRGTLRTAASGITQRWAMRSENRSPRYTTHWRELPVAH